MTFRIVCGAMYRTGSVWQLNAIRLCFEQAGYSVFCCAPYPEHYRPDHGADVEVLSVRAVDIDLANTADSICSTWRHPDGIRASMRRRAAYLSEHPDGRFRNEADVDRFEEFQERARCWQLRAEYIQVFDLIRAAPEVLVANYLNLYGLEADPERVLEALTAQMVPPAEGIDTRTWLHAGHITLERQ